MVPRWRNPRWSALFSSSWSWRPLRSSAIIQQFLWRVGPSDSKCSLKQPPFLSSSLWFPDRFFFFFRPSFNTTSTCSYELHRVLLMSRWSFLPGFWHKNQNTTAVQDVKRNAETWKHEPLPQFYGFIQKQRMAERQTSSGSNTQFLFFLLVGLCQQHLATQSAELGRKLASTTQGPQALRWQVLITMAKEIKILIKKKKLF